MVALAASNCFCSQFQSPGSAIWYSNVAGDDDAGLDALVHGLRDFAMKSHVSMSEDR